MSKMARQSHASTDFRCDDALRAHALNLASLQFFLPSFLRPAHAHVLVLAVSRRRRGIAAAASLIALSSVLLRSRSDGGGGSCASVRVRASLHSRRTQVETLRMRRAVRCASYPHQGYNGPPSLRPPPARPPLSHQPWRRAKAG